MLCMAYLLDHAHPTPSGWERQVKHRPGGYKVCAETAAKFEATTPRATSILTSIRDSRKQLPDDHLGVIFIKVPERWVRNTELADRITNVAKGYLNQSEHIRSIK